MKRLALFVIVVITACQSTPKFEFSEIKFPTQEHLRGVSCVDENIVWASGTKGTVVVSKNAGETWKKISVPGAETMDFRDIHAFSDKLVFVMTAGSPGRIYKTEDGGQVWYVLYNNESPEVFMDGMDFVSPSKGFLYGDPLDGSLMAMRTNNGKIWQRIISKELKPLEKEAGYAASGTGVVVQNDLVWLATGGGAVSRVHASKDFGNSWKSYEVPIRSAEGAGIFSIAFKDSLFGIAVGGDYRDSTRADSNGAITIDGGITWELLEKNELRGYRSCVAVLPWNGKKIFVASGRTGVDYSLNGTDWEPILDEGFYAMNFTENQGWLVGRSGKMMRLSVKNN